MAQGKITADNGEGTGDDTCDCAVCVARRAGQAAQARGDSQGAARAAVQGIAAALASGRKPADLGDVTVRVNGQVVATTAEKNEATPSGDEALKVAEREARKPVERFLVQAPLTTQWADVIGNTDAKAALQAAVEHPVTHKDLYAYYGRKPARGVLLYGAPGCGKTMLARATAAAQARLYSPGKAKVSFLQIKGPELQTPYVGQTEQFVRQIFAYAKAYAARRGHPLVIFIDEADAILPPRTNTNRRTNSWEESCVATFLTEMDGLEESGAFVILATNRPEAIDEAILRPGRIDVKVRVERPDRLACSLILRNNLKGTPLDSNRGVQSLTDMCTRAVDYMLSPAHVLQTLQSNVGPLHLTMRHIVSGAMISSLADVAKEGAFTRDLQSKTRTGLRESDLTAAVDTLFKQNEGLVHNTALYELCAAAGATVATSAPALPDEEQEGPLLTKAKAPAGFKLN